MTNHVRAPRLVALGLAVSLALAGAACGDDNSAVDDGVAPTSAPDGFGDSDGNESLATAIEGLLESYNVEEGREEGDNIIAVMAEDATDENVASTCQLLTASGRPVFIERDGEQTACP